MKLIDEETCRRALAEIDAEVAAILRMQDEHIAQIRRGHEELKRNLPPNFTIDQVMEWYERTQAAADAASGKKAEAPVPDDELAQPLRRRSQHIEPASIVAVPTGPNDQPIDVNVLGLRLGDGRMLDLLRLNVPATAADAPGAAAETEVDGLASLSAEDRAHAEDYILGLKHQIDALAAKYRLQ
ncbi:hypothetical protein H9P43_008492 [Blastocladiella emersonii ATCC 22665]|nr:hypothetical protein H9P43_008492 [Blastocladiella emersonii ATCC 22665]